MKRFKVTVSSLKNSLVGRKEFNILLLGLEDSGKTTALFKLKNYPQCNLIPTVFYNREVIKHENVIFVMNEVTGRERMRPLWRHFFKGTQAVVFFIDSNDPERIDEAKEEIERLLKDDEIDGIPFLILANKRDLPDSMTVRDITKKLSDLLEKYSERCYIQATSAIYGEGLIQGLDWLKIQLTQNKKR